MRRAQTHPVVALLLVSVLLFALAWYVPSASGFGWLGGIFIVFAFVWLLKSKEGGD